jgi:hypothetical protein
MLANLKITVQTLLRPSVLVALMGLGQAASTIGLEGTDGAVEQAAMDERATTLRAGSMESPPILISGGGDKSVDLLNPGDEAVGSGLSRGYSQGGRGNSSQKSPQPGAGSAAEAPEWPYRVFYLGYEAGFHRDLIVFPEVEGYQILKGEFHIHTLYSDGQVTPEVRVYEAWRDGMDVLAITDHPEYLKVAFPNDRGRAYDRAKQVAAQLDLLLIHSAEVTTSSTVTASLRPPRNSDYTAHFISDESTLSGDYPSVFKSASQDQRGILVWAHPHTEWVPEARGLMKSGRLDGIEIKNTQVGNRLGTQFSLNTWFYPQVMDWCLENNLAVFAVSDAHWPIDLLIDRSKGERRPMTLLLSKSRDPQGVYEAIKERRTLAYFNEMIWGQERWLKAVAEASLQLHSPEPADRSEFSMRYFSVQNRSSVPFVVRFSLNETDGSISFNAALSSLPGSLPKTMRLAPNSTTLVPFTLKTNRDLSRPLEIQLIVTNLLSGVDRPLQLRRMLKLAN